MSTAQSSSRRSRRVAGSVVATVALLAVGGAIAGLVVGGSGPDRADPGATAAAFSTAYATGGDVCELATPDFAAELHAEGRCAHSAGEPPRVEVLFATPCTTRALAGVAISPSDAFGQPYALLGMQRGPDETWAVDSVTPLSDRQAVAPGRCDTEGAS